MDVELSASEAEMILANLRNEKQLIARWLLEGYYCALLKLGNPMGRA